MFHANSSGGSQYNKQLQRFLLEEAYTLELKPEFLFYRNFLYDINVVCKAANAPCTSVNGTRFLVIEEKADRSQGGLLQLSYGVFQKMQ